MKLISDKEYEQFLNAKEEIERAWNAQQEIARKYYLLRIDYDKLKFERKHSKKDNDSNDVMIGVKEIEEKIINLRSIYKKDYDRFQIALSAYLVGYYDSGVKDEA